MKEYILDAELWVPRPRDEVFVERIFQYRRQRLLELFGPRATRVGGDEIPAER